MPLQQQTAPVFYYTAARTRDSDVETDELVKDIDIVLNQGGNNAAADTAESLKGNAPAGSWRGRLMLLWPPDIDNYIHFASLYDVWSNRMRTKQQTRQ